MKIFSAFRDYYDSVQAFDPDPTCVYERKREEIEISPNQSDLIPKHNEGYNKWGYRYHFDTHVHERILGFCGKLYPYLLIDNSYPDPNTYHGRIGGVTAPKKWLSKSPTGPLYFYDIELFRRVLVQNDFFNKKADMKHLNGAIENHAKFLKEWSDFESKMFVKFKTPIFITKTVSKWARNFGHGHKIEVTLNPSLDVLEFYKVKNSFEAYQEIEQFLSGILGMNDPPMVQIADKDMVVKKGFDKMSFRKPPGKRKPRKQKIAES